MTRSILACTAAVSAALLVPQPAAAEYRDGSITVSAPRLPRAEPKDGVRQPLYLVSQVSVETRDLNLRSEYGRDLLDRRVRIAAAQACDDLDLETAGVGANLAAASQDCRLRAVKDAQPQVRAAIWANG